MFTGSSRGNPHVPGDETTRLAGGDAGSDKDERAAARAWQLDRWTQPKFNPPGTEG